MPQKFTFPSISQAMSLQSAIDMEQVKKTLRKWFNSDSNLKLSQNVSWNFKYGQGSTVDRRYIHCKFCQAKLIYVKHKQNISNSFSKCFQFESQQTKDNISDIFRLAKFNLHHNHRDIQDIKRKGKRKALPHIYTQPQINPYSCQKQRKLRKQILRKKRVKINKYKKLQLYYRVTMLLNQDQTQKLKIKQIVAKHLGISQQRLKNFLKSNLLAVEQVQAIKQLLKKVKFQKYNIQHNQTNSGSSNHHHHQEYQQQNLKQINSQDQEDLNNERKRKSDNQILRIASNFYKSFMIFVNYNQLVRNNLLSSQGFIKIHHIPNAIHNKKTQAKIEWDLIVLYSHDQNFKPNMLYSIIMIDSQQFNFKQIKKAFEITFKLLSRSDNLKFQCCIYQENIFIMGGLDLIIDEINRVKQKINVRQKYEQHCELPKSNQNSPENNFGYTVNYILSPKLSKSIIQKCEFIPKVFKKKFIEKICLLDQKYIQIQFKKLNLQLQKASRIKQYQEKAKQYLSSLKDFTDNSHKIFLGKIQNPSFLSLSFECSYNDFTMQNDQKQHVNLNSQRYNNRAQKYCIEEELQRQLYKYSNSKKCFFQFLIMIFDIFQIPKGSFIYHKYEGQTRLPKRIQTHYSNNIILNQPNYIDSIKKFYNTNALRTKDQTLKVNSLNIKKQNQKVQNQQQNQQSKSLKQNADFFEQFTALLYQNVYQLKSLYMKLVPQIMAIVIKQIQKSFTLQIQTRTIDRIKNQSNIKVKQGNKAPFVVKLIKPQNFWTFQTGKQKNKIANKSSNWKQIIELNKSMQLIEIQNQDIGKNDPKGNSNSNQQIKIVNKKIWQCSCKYSRFTFLPCCHQIRCCLTFFTSIQDQVGDVWMFKLINLQNLQHTFDRSDNQSELNEEQRQNNSQSD